MVKRGTERQRERRKRERERWKDKRERKKWGEKETRLFSKAPKVSTCISYSRLIAVDFYLLQKSKVCARLMVIGSRYFVMYVRVQAVSKDAMHCEFVRFFFFLSFSFFLYIQLYILLLKKVIERFSFVIKIQYLIKDVF